MATSGQEVCCLSQIQGILIIYAQCTLVTMLRSLSSTGYCLTCTTILQPCPQPHTIYQALSPFQVTGPDLTPSCTTYRTVYLMKARCTVSTPQETQEDKPSNWARTLEAPFSETRVCMLSLSWASQPIFLYVLCLLILL